MGLARDLGLRLVAQTLAQLAAQVQPVQSPLEAPPQDALEV